MMTGTIEISKAFNKHAKEYEVASKVQQEIGRRMFDRLEFLKISPKYILDLGCGIGSFSLLLKKKFPKATVIGLDLAHAMLLQAKQKQGFRRRWPLVNADMLQMPFPTGLFDLVFANQVIHWGNPLPGVFRELNRVMNGNACLMFSTLGPDTFQELKQAWSGVNSFAHANAFADMHDVGDFLMSEHFVEPVVDMEVLTLHYNGLQQLVRSLKAQGVKNINPERNQGLTGKYAWSQFETNYAAMQTEQGKYPLTYEVIYGHAWKGVNRQIERGTETRISVLDIVRGKRKSDTVV
jgi:malonyl-CoA O-methyltransferase